MFGGTDTNIFYSKNVEGGGTSEGNHSSNEEDNAVGFIIPKGIVDEYSSGHGLPVLRDEDVLEKHSDKKSISSGEEDKQAEADLARPEPSRTTLKKSSDTFLPSYHRKFNQAKDASAQSSRPTTVSQKSSGVGLSAEKMLKYARVSNRPQKPRTANPRHR